MVKFASTFFKKIVLIIKGGNMENKFGDFIAEYPPDCGNAPKKILLRDFTIAWAKKEQSSVFNLIAEHIMWNIAGHKTIHGKSEFEKQWNELNNDDVAHLKIHHIITHGNVASVNGITVLRDGRKIAFCHVYQFSGFGKKAKIKEITSYLIETDK